MTLNIPLIENWRIRSDSSNIILGRVDGDREVESYFYSTITGALESFIDRKIRGFDSNSIFGLLQAINSLQTRLNKAILPLKLKVVAADEGKNG